MQAERRRSILLMDLPLCRFSRPCGREEDVEQSMTAVSVQTSSAAVNSICEAICRVGLEHQSQLENIEREEPFTSQGQDFIERSRSSVNFPEDQIYTLDLVEGSNSEDNNEREIAGRTDSIRGAPSSSSSEGEVVSQTTNKHSNQDELLVSFHTIADLITSRKLLNSVSSMISCRKITRM